MEQQPCPPEEVRKPMLDQTSSKTDNWRGLVLCQGMDTNTFFPVSSAGPLLIDIIEAKRVCGRCPVQWQGLGFAADQGVDHGIWGGLTETERRALKLRQVRHRNNTQP